MFYRNLTLTPIDCDPNPISDLIQDSHGGMSLKCDPSLGSEKNRSDFYNSLTQLQLQEKSVNRSEELEPSDEEQHLDILLKKMVQKLHHNEKAYASLQD